MAFKRAYIFSYIFKFFGENLGKFSEQKNTFKNPKIIQRPEVEKKSSQCMFFG